MKQEVTPNDIVVIYSSTSVQNLLTAFTTAYTYISDYYGNVDFPKLKIRIKDPSLNEYIVYSITRYRSSNNSLGNVYFDAISVGTDYSLFKEGTSFYTRIYEYNASSASTYNPSISEFYLFI